MASGRALVTYGPCHADSLSTFSCLNSCIGVNRPAIVWEIPHFGLFPAFLPERPAFLALFQIKKSLKIAIIVNVGDILFEKALQNVNDTVA